MKNNIFILTIIAVILATANVTALNWTLADSTERIGNITEIGATVTTTGNMLTFTGATGQRTNTSNSAYLDCGESATLKCTLSMNVYKANTGVIGDLIGYSTTNRKFYMYVQTDDTVQQDITNSTGTEGYSGGVATITPGTWNNIIVEFNGSHITTYIDGTLGGSYAIPGGLLRNTSGNFQISPGYSQYWNGSIDEVKMWNTTLNSSDRTAVAANQSNVKCTDMTLWYAFSEDQQICNATTTTSASVNINYSSTGTQIQPDYYGYSSTYAWTSNVSMMIDKNSDGSVDTASNTTFHRTTMQELKVNYIRLDADLNQVAYANRTFKETGENRNDAENVRNSIRYAAEETAAGRPTKVLIILGYMPSWLAESNVSRCAAGASSCMYSNRTRWIQLIDDYMNYATDNHANDAVVKTEVWNEPTIQFFWLENLAEDTQYKTRASVYADLYNATYEAVKNYNSSIEVGGGGFAFYTYYMTNTHQTWLQSVCNQTNDFVSYHPYPISVDMNETMQRFYNNVTAYCPAGTKINQDEWNYRDANVQVNQSNTVFRKQIFQGYQWPLNTNASKFTSMLFDWMQPTPYGVNSSEYPLRWMSVFESNGALAATYYEAANITKRLANNHTAGSYVVPYTTNSSSLLLVATNNAGTRRFTIMNTGATAIDAVNITLTGISPSSITNLDNGSVVSLSGSTYNIGYLDAYELQTYLASNSTSIAINTTTPSTPLSIVEPNNQTFSFTLNNTDAQTVSITWSFNGTTQTTCNDTTTCTFTGNYTSAGNYNISFTASAATNNVSYTWNFTVNNTVANISYSTTSPATPVSIDEPNSQAFSVSITNPSSNSVTYEWLVNGTNQTGSYNSSSYTFTGGYSTAGTYNITNRVYSSSNNLTYSWALTVNEVTPPTPANACEEAASSFGLIASWFIVFVTIFMAIIIVFAIKGVMQIEWAIMGVVGMLVLAFVMFFAIAITTGASALC